MENSVNEAQLQVQCFTWHWNTFPSERQMLYHVNNNSHNKIAGNIKKQAGVVAGIADFTLILHGMVIWIELKIPGGRQSEDQKDFQHKVEERGHEYYLIFSFEEFKNLINKIYGTLGKG